MQQMDLCGTGVALITPFNEDYSVDYNALGNIVDHVVAGGVDYLVVMGTTGESVTIEKEEKQKVFDCIVERNRNRVPIVLGLGGNNTAHVVETLKNGDLTNVQAILSVSPYYNKPNQDGIYLHYKAIADATDKPVILYNVPGRTGKNIKAQTIVRLAKDFKNIVAVKEASGDMNQVMQVIKDKPKGFQVISGDDALTFPLMALGGCGVISVVANAYPAEFSNMVRMLNALKIKEARKIQYKLVDMIGLLFEDGSPAGIKALLHTMGLCKNVLRLPLTPLSEGLYKKIKAERKRIG
jgi:4-hydroxy-tetrahydrodipicolinate synthase